MLLPLASKRGFFPVALAQVPGYWGEALFGSVLIHGFCARQAV